MLDSCPQTAAQMHCDKHVVKMILETAQMLSTVYHWHGIEYEHLYKKAFEHHPCTKWVNAGAENFYYLVSLFFSLCEEYTFRYNKTHLTEQKLGKFFDISGGKMYSKLPPGSTTPALAMPDCYKSKNPIESYREYYIGAKSYMARWDKGRPAPEWYTEAVAYDS